MKARLLSTLLVFALLLALVPGVQAQGDEVCFNLSAEDCTLLQAALAANEGAESYNLDFSLDALLGGLSMFAAMAGVDASEAPGDITLNVTGGGPVAMTADAQPPIAFDMAISASFDDGTESDSFASSARLVDGMLYMQDPDNQEWAGGPLTEMLATLDPSLAGMVGGFIGGSAEGDLPSGALNPDDLMSGDMTSMLEDAGIEDAAALMEIPGFINMTRLDDQEFDGQMMHVFQLTIDAAPLFASEAFQGMISETLTAASEEDPEAAQMAMLVPMLITGVELTVVQTQMFSVDDMYLHNYNMNLDASLDLSALMMASGGDSEMQIPPITLSADFEATFNQINETFEIVAPEGATILSAEDMQ
jgi:hypothetical protein